MRSTMLYGLSFLLGVIVTFITLRLFTRQSVVDAQEGLSSSIPFVPTLKTAVPIVPALPRVLFENSLNIRSGAPSEFLLDGMVGDHITFVNPAGVKFVYGGGAFRLEKSVMAGPLQFEFVGAAANTVNLLDSLGLLVHASVSTPNPAALPTPEQINKPRQQKIRLNKPLRSDVFLSQYDGSEPK